jgi:hypothetical protein
MICYGCDPLGHWRRQGAELKLRNAAGRLCAAAFSDDLFELQRLVENGISCNTGDYDGRTGQSGSAATTARRGPSLLWDWRIHHSRQWHRWLEHPVSHGGACHPFPSRSRLVPVCVVCVCVYQRCTWGRARATPRWWSTSCCRPTSATPTASTAGASRPSSTPSRSAPNGHTPLACVLFVWSARSTGLCHVRNVSARDSILLT